MFFNFHLIYDIREGFTKIVAVLLDFVHMRGGEGPAQFFLPLYKCIFDQGGLLDH